MLGRKTILVVITRIFIALIEAIAFILAVQTFLPEQFGNQKIITSLLGFFTFFATFGLSLPHIKIMSESVERKDNETNTVFSTFLVIKLILIIFSTIIVSSVFLYQLNKGFIPNEKEIISIFVLIFCQYLYISIKSVFRLSLISKLNVAKTEIPAIVGSIVQFAVSLIGIFVFGNFIVYISSLMITPLIEVVFFISKGYFKFTRFDLNIFKRYVKLGGVFVLIDIMITVTINLGPFFFLLHYNSELLGIYAVIASFFAMIKTIGDTFQSLLLPNFTHLLINNKINELKKLIHLFEKYLTIISALLIMGLIIFAQIIITSLLGELYYNKGIYLFYFSIIVIFDIPLFKPYFNLLIAAEKLSVIFYISSLSFIFSLFSWIFLIPYLNIIGIDFGYWVFILIGVIIIRIYSQKKWNIGKPSKRLLLNLIIVCLLIAGCLVVVSMVNLSFTYSVLFYILICGVYGVFLILSKNIKKEDIKIIKDILNTKKMVKYIKSEF